VPKTGQFWIRFWGVRGSIPVPGLATSEYGGNTACAEVQIGQTKIIIDSGSGIRQLGFTLLTQLPMKATLLHSHYHWDHIQGFPFFTPAYIPGNQFLLVGPPTPQGMEIQDILSGQMRSPYFPVTMDIMAAALTYRTVKPGDFFTIDKDIQVHVRQLNHSEITVGYRIVYKNHILAYVSDTEHFSDKLDNNVLELAQNADIMIYDAMYTDEEYHNPKSPKKGWGHSTWTEGVKLAKAAGVKRLAFFHHEPTHTDTFMRDLEQAVQKIYAHAFVAREGMTLILK